MYKLKELVQRDAGPSYARVPESSGTTDPLLPSYSTTKDEENDDNSDNPTFTSATRSPPQSIGRRLLLPLLVVAGLFGALALVAYLMRSPTPEALPPPQKVPPETAAPPATDVELAKDPVAAARISLDALFERQSHTLAQAEARYSLKTDRPPPRNYAQWFEFAQKNKCLIDDYDQIHRDLEPFYQLSTGNPSHFADMINRGREMMLKDSMGMTTITIKDKDVHMPDYRGTSFYDDWKMIIGNFVSLLPDMDFLLNGRDEPRVVFNYRDPNARKNAMVLKDPNPFHLEPRPTSEFFQDQSGCSPLSSPLGFATDASADIAFIRSSSSSDFTTDLWPLLSMTKISPCFSDILFPGPYDYDQSWWSGSFSHPNDIQWKDKKPIIYWRGMSNGGHIIGQNYHKFPRFRLVALARNHTDLIDAKMTRFAETHCTDDCDRNHIIEEYDITGPQSAKEEIYKFKYLLDVDGNTFSGRFLGLLKSGSLVFKSTVFDEYFNDWLRPYEHFIPVLPDLSDLVEKLHWAIANEDEARRIQETGKLFTERIMNDRQNDCYFSLLLLEWARLQSYSLQNATDFSRPGESESTADL
ncbi:glycosyl transferase family 90-domain-containing protein [Mycena filopes]|nr:glycosyl transferase family 90-domain-containing protein [Mycena filopes]